MALAYLYVSHRSTTGRNTTVRRVTDSTAFTGSSREEDAFGEAIPIARRLAGVDSTVCLLDITYFGFTSETYFIAEYEKWKTLHPQKSIAPTEVLTPSACGRVPISPKKESQIKRIVVFKCSQG